MAGEDDVFNSGVRFDDQPVKTVRWNESTTNEATFVENPEEFLEYLIEAETVFTRIWDFSGEANDAEFEVMGLAEAMGKYSNLCGP